jgi:hypothetical protein
MKSKKTPPPTATKTRKRAYRTFPGCIFVRGNKLYLKIKGKQISTRLTNLQEGWKIAKNMLREKYLASQGIGSLQTQSKSIQIETAFEQFLHEHCSNKAPTTVTSYTDAFHKIVTNNYYVNVERITEDIARFVSSSSHLSPVTINLHLRSFQVFLMFCYKRQILPTLVFTKRIP